MKRVLTFVIALALAVGAMAPAAFASDAGYGQTDLIPLEDLDQETFDNYLAKFYSQDYPTYGVLDLIRDTFKGGLSNASGLNDSPWSWALNLVDNASDLGTEVGLWMRGVKIDPNTGMAIYPDDYLTDYAKEQLDTQLKSAPASNLWNASHGQWVSTPISGSYNGYSGYLTVWRSGTYYDNMSVYVTRLSNGLFCYASYITDSNEWYLSFKRDGGGGNSLGYVSIYPGYTIDGSRYATGSYNDWFDIGISTQSYYTSASIAWDDFYNSELTGGGVADWNGSGYYSDHQDGFSINLPSLPSTNWGNLSKYYYTTYGDEIVEGDNVDRYYYNIANNYAPYEISYELPYWLINGSSNVLDFNYDLELPDADLYSVPSDFEGGSGFWDKAFSSLGGFGAFIMLGLSFGLVALFFKD